CYALLSPGLRRHALFCGNWTGRPLQSAPHGTTWRIKAARGSMSDRQQAGESPFPNTAWSMVARAAHVRSSVRRRTLEALIRQYQPALRSYLMARRRVGPHEADDLLQGFLAGKVLEQQILRRADRTRGKFRTFLMTALERFSISEYRRQ